MNLQRLRPSEMSPEAAMPRWSSTLNIFCRDDVSSESARFKVANTTCVLLCRGHSRLDAMYHRHKVCFRHDISSAINSSRGSFSYLESHCCAALLDSLHCVFHLVNSTLRAPSDHVCVILLQEPSQQSLPREGHPVSCEAPSCLISKHGLSAQQALLKQEVVHELSRKVWEFNCD